MITIATLLRDSGSDTTQSLWKFLEDQCDLTKIWGAPLPHLSWLTMDDCDVERVTSVLESLAKEVSPFPLHTAGLGLFTGAKPVLYLATMKTRKMIDLNQFIWQQTEGLCRTRNPYYAPDYWIPHITLAYEDLTGDNIACAVRDLINKPLEYQLRVDNLAILYKKDSDYGLITRFDFFGC